MFPIVLETYQYFITLLVPVVVLKIITEIVYNAFYKGSL